MRSAASEEAEDHRRHPEAVSHREDFHGLGPACPGTAAGCRARTPQAACLLCLRVQVAPHPGPRGGCSRRFLRTVVVGVRRPRCPWKAAHSSARSVCRTRCWCTARVQLVVATLSNFSQCTTPAFRCGPIGVSDRRAFVAVSSLPRLRRAGCSPRSSSSRWWLNHETHSSVTARLDRLACFSRARADGSTKPCTARDRLGQALS